MMRWNTYVRFGIVSASALFYLIIGPSPSHAVSYDWSEPEYPAFSTGIGPGRGVSIGADGMHRAVVTNFGNSVYVSSDAGASWTTVTLVRSGSDSYAGFDRVAVSDDGTHVVVTSGPHVYVSTDGGSGWTESTPIQGASEELHWAGVVMDSDGSTIVAFTSDNGDFYVSSDAGESWLAENPLGPSLRPRWNVTISSDRLMFVAISSQGGFRSADGMEWMPITSVPGVTPESVATSGDGVRMLVGGVSALYESDDSGDHWNEVLADVGDDPSWRSVTMSSSGNRMMAAAYGNGIFVSDDAGNTWEQVGPDVPHTAFFPASASDAAGTAFMVGAQNGLFETYLFEYADGWSWSIVNHMTTAYSWNSVSASDDGRRLVAGSESGLFLSTDAGSSWEELDPGTGAGRSWSSVGISGDGTRMLVGRDGGGLYVSTDAGETWTSQTPGSVSGSETWRITSVSGDGNVFIAGVYGGRLYRGIPDSEGHVSWDEMLPAGDADYDWYSLSMSENGERLIASVDGGGLYVSMDGGAAWAQQYPGSLSDSEYWDAVGMSDDGSRLMAAVWGGRVFVSVFGADGVAGWEEIRPDGDADHDWSAVSLNDDGTRLAVAAYDGRMYLSDDSGDSWQEERPAGAENNYWTALSFGGNRLVAASEDGGGLFVGSAIEQEDEGGDEPSGDDEEDASAPRADIDSWKAYLVERTSSSCRTKLKLEIRGRRFDRDVEVEIGNKKATSVSRKSSRELTATFCYDKLVGVRSDPDRRISVVNPGNDAVKADSKIRLDRIFGKFVESDMRTNDTDGVRNIQKALVRLGLLDPDSVTGYYGPLTTRAVRSFQSANGLPVTGMVGPATRAKLAERYARKT